MFFLPVYQDEKGKIMEENSPPPTLLRRISTKIIGRPRNINDPSIFHKLSLIALLSWIGLGADGLSSSSYGPEEAFKAIAGHTYLAIFLAIATAITVFVISYTYSKIIEQFPHGGGGYIVATHTLGNSAGVVSGSALLIDYILTITVSIAACGDAIFSFLPLEYHQYSIVFKITLIFILILLNLRGVKESVAVLTPIFLLFIVTHVLLLGYGIGSQAPIIGTRIAQVPTGLNIDLQTIGMLGILSIFLRAFSLGSGTYTGIEAVSNGLPVMREPKVKTGKRTMLYMAVSLSLVAGGLFICYYLLDIQHVQGQTLNAVLATNLFGGWPGGILLAAVIIFSEGLLLFVAAQTGFIDGPRVMANMAVDSWFPKKFSALSERLTMRNGVWVMGLAALLLMIGTNGSISFLVIMYAINVFLTFSLSQVGMAKFTIQNRKKKEHWKRYFLIFIIGFVLCFTILIITIYEKISEGGWLTLFITLAVIIICYWIRGHYQKIKKAMKKFDEVLLLSSIHLVGHPNTKPVNPKHMTAAILVTGYNGYGVNTFLSLIRSFPGLYKNIIFISIAEIDSGSFKGAEEIEALKTSVRSSLLKYVILAQRLGFCADYRMDVGTDVVETASHLCESIAEEFPKVMFFTAKLVFRHETIFHKILHNETAFSVQRRLQWKGLPVVILPVRIDI
jgi:amino acid transporter